MRGAPLTCTLCRALTELLDKLYGMGMIQTKRLLACDKIAASTLARRRLPVVLVRLKFAETMREAAKSLAQTVGTTPAEMGWYALSRVVGLMPKMLRSRI